MITHRARWTCLAIFALALWAAPVLGQIRIPTENTIEDLQFFAPADRSHFGGKPYLNKGFFGSYERLMWSVQRPDVALIGAPGETILVTNSVVFIDPAEYRAATNGPFVPLVPPDPVTGQTRVPVNPLILPDDLNQFIEENQIETGDFEDLLHEGARIEFGYMGECTGWRFRSTDLNERLQRFDYSSAAVIFEDPQRITRQSFITGQNGFDLDLDQDGNFGRQGQDALGVTIPLSIVINTPIVTPGGAVILIPTVVQIPTFAPNGLPDVGFSGDPNNPDDRIPLFGRLIDPQFPDFGDVAEVSPDFNEITVTNSTDFWGLDLVGLRRLETFVLGGHLELLGGARFISFGEQFRFHGRGSSVLASTNIVNEAENNILGPTVGLRWFKSFPNCTISLEGQFLSGFNAQAVRLRSTIGDGFGVTTGSSLPFQNSSNDSFHAYEFAPVGELNASLHFQLTRAISFKAGWTGTYIDNIARPSNMIRYLIPSPQIIEANNGDNAMMQGAHVGIEINR